MTVFNKSFVIEQIELVSNWQAEYRWLSELGVIGPAIAHFNCGTGESTLGLMWAVQGVEAVGFDVDLDTLQVARDRFFQLRWEMGKIWEGLHESDSIPVSDFTWWNDEVPEYFKQNLFNEHFILSFQPWTIPPNTRQLDHEAYDLAFCDMVLHQIWWDRARKDPEEDTRVVIGSMLRAVRPGGYLAAIEWVEQKFRPRLDYRRLFEQLQMDVIYTKEVRLDNWRGRGQAAVFLCLKRAV